MYYLRCLCLFGHIVLCFCFVFLYHMYNMMPISLDCYFWLGAWVAQWVRSLDLTAHTSLSPIRRGFVHSFVNNNKRCTRLAAASDKVYQLLAQGRWFSPGTPASSTTKTGRYDRAEILLKVALKTTLKIIHFILPLRYSLPFIRYIFVS